MARGRAEGIRYMPLTPGGAARSYWAALLCLPCFLLLQPGLPVTPRALTAEFTGFVVGWAGYGLAALPLVLASGRAPLWPRLLAAWNWVNLLQYVVLGLVTLLVPAGLPDWLAQGLILAGVGYAMWLQWFAARLALQIDRVRALGFVLLDLMLSYFISGVVAALSRG
jgi:hypothetical protein